MTTLALMPGMAGTTAALSPVHARVLRGVLMSLRAVRAASLAVRLPKGQAASHVYLRRDSIKVVRINAGPVTTEMVDLETSGNRTEEVLIREAVRATRATAPVERTVTSPILLRSPLPTSAGQDAEVLGEPHERGSTGLRSNHPRGYQFTGVKSGLRPLDRDIEGEFLGIGFHGAGWLRRRRAGAGG